MEPSERLQRLSQIKDSVQQGHTESYSVREVISWFNAERRGYLVSSQIRKEFENLNLITLPDFEGAHIDARVLFQVRTSETATALPNQQDHYPNDLEEPQELHDNDSTPKFITGASSEPAFRVSRLPSSCDRPLYVNPECNLVEAITLMLRHDYSQLPVMTNERAVKGIISWSSIAPRVLLLNTATVNLRVRDCMKPHVEVFSTDSLFKVISSIIEHSAVLVRGEDHTITGIITTADLSIHFQQLSEPFLLLAEIENHIRLLIDGKFTDSDLAAVKDPADTGRTIKSVADLTFGEYIRLLENPNCWSKASLPVDRSVFVKELSEIRNIRNDVMHFDPDGISKDNHRKLLNFVRFLHELRTLQ